ncbi:hypothetical protein DOTSEDRAFT_121211 [Dothistroma septosporum NZE10]|uniref:Phosphogluconate dehydrogenase NAD-binding putative C-terminal domain-containing protein n=1 Tax=Dothistroma septosporum (strain NZE10 / CBS 128990) TaxID=675120 RepID=N1Q496_DOTSN|nr:hypothetical protein DOTSEDRAFT_121211 [Dothistroma septosporum NZE10]
MALAKVGIISIGDMGVGIARMLIANGYKVSTNASDRSQATQLRASTNDIALVKSDIELCNQVDYVLSIVPPKEATATAARIAKATNDSDFQKRKTPLYYLDLNAISPRSARQVDELLTANAGKIRFIDGGIIGGPPSLKDDGTWSRPRIPLSGAYTLTEALPSGEHLCNVLNATHINDTIGSASGLKMCFASLSKGFTALAIQSFTAAHSLGVVEELQTHLDEYSPGVRTRAEKGLVSMPPKAYRWVNEMEQIAETFEADGGFSKDESIFRSIAQVYDLVANGTELGKETTEARHRGKTADDVAKIMAEGTERRKVKTD